MPTLDQDRLGTTIGDGKYTLESVLGRGGMGTVFEATHRWTGRRVAVKLLESETALDIEASQRFLQEARSATAIDHPNVVEVLDMGRHDESSAYMVFELLRGESLADRLERLGPLDALQAATILLPVADALAAAHLLGIVHRDVKPENIFLEDDGMGYVRPKLLDFGIACASEREGDVSDPGVIIGTPGYLSPEQAQGLYAGPASDVWSLGVVLFECLTGTCPFESESLPGAILAVMSRPAPSLRASSHVPELVAQLVERSLVRDPVVRFPDGASFRDALAAASQVDFLPSRSRSVPSRILSDDGELALSSAHRVEVRQSTPPAGSTRVPTPTPEPARTETPSRRPPREAVEMEAVTGRMDSLPLLVPARTPWRRRAMFSAAVLVILLVPIVGFTLPSQAGGGDASAPMAAAPAFDSTMGALPSARDTATLTSTAPSSLSSPAVPRVVSVAEEAPAPRHRASRGRARPPESDAYVWVPPDSEATEAVAPSPEPVATNAEPVDAPEVVAATPGSVEAAPEPVTDTSPVDQGAGLIDSVIVAAENAEARAIED